MLPPVAALPDRPRPALGLRRGAPEARRHVQQAQHELDGITAALVQEFPGTNQGIGAIVTPFKDYWLGGLRTGLVFLTIGACILLLIACINIASLLLTRAVAQRRAWAIRLALGASRPRLIRQLLTESILLSLIGAVAGLLLGHWAVRLLIAFSGARFPSFVQIRMQPEVILVTVGLAVLCGLAFGLAPVGSSFFADITQSLGRSEKMEASSRGWRWFQNAVVIAQVALALTLSVDALLMAKSFRQLIDRDLGFRSENLLTFRVDIREPKYFNDDVAAKMLRETYLPRIAAVPGVRQMAMSDPSIPTDDWVGTFIAVEGHDSEPVRRHLSRHRPRGEPGLLRDPRHPDPEGPQLQHAGRAVQRRHRQQGVGRPAMARSGPDRQADQAGRPGETTSPGSTWSGSRRRSSRRASWRRRRLRRPRSTCRCCSWCGAR